MAEAEAAFELAAHIPVKGGQYLYEVLALRDLKLLVLDQDGRGAYIHAIHNITIISLVVPSMQRVMMAGA
eukprot:COSAG01_NODE_2413_length_7745_cov_2.532304_4_plen_70_part_00